MNQPKQCYMCDENPTSREHVPPKCLFKKGFKENLITVPSCNEHNLNKSHDDEYLKDILGSCIIESDNNEYQNALKNSIDRSYERNSNFRKDIINSTFTINGEFAKIVDRERLENIFHHIVSGLLFHHYKKQWLGQCKFIFLFMNPNEETMRIHDDMSLIFKECVECGDNKEIFKYKITSTELLPAFSIQMIFFNSITIIGYGNID